MPGSNVDNLPEGFREGEPISASQMTKLVDAMRRQVLQPGQFQSGSFSVQRPMGGFGGGGDSDIHEGRVVTEISGRVDWDEYGVGEVTEDVVGAGPPNITVKNIFWQKILVGTPVWFIYRDGVAYILVPGC